MLTEKKLTISSAFTSDKCPNRANLTLITPQNHRFNYSFSTACPWALTTLDKYTIKRANPPTEALNAPVTVSPTTAIVARGYWNEVCGLTTFGVGLNCL
jgi:hypothetical protein